jgi:hypothetical protein
MIAPDRAADLARLAACLDEDAAGCWVWLGGLNRPGGYGRIWWHGGYHLVHVLMWSLTGHRVRRGCEMHHRCHNRRCCNPDHLQPVTRRVHRRLTHTERRHR